MVVKYLIYIMMEVQLIELNIETRARSIGGFVLVTRVAPIVRDTPTHLALHPAVSRPPHTR